MTEPTVFEAIPATRSTFLLGEGPVWDPAGERLLWVDIENGRVHTGVLDGERLKAGEQHEFPHRVGAAAWAGDGALVVAGDRGVLVLEPDGTRREVAGLVPAGADSRLNDGKCDPAGRFVVGSMALDDREGAESLWQIDGDGHVRVLDADLSLSNGLAWSPDGSVLYSIDTTPGTVWARSYDVTTGACGPRRVLFTVTGGNADGMCTDAAGNLWIAIWGGSEVRCYTPEGEIVARVRVEGAPHTSCPAFVGPDLDLMVITTARTGLSEADLAGPAARSGLIFTARVGVSGVPVAPARIGVPS
jgi:sugar lactone lactonase YvrE